MPSFEKNESRNYILTRISTEIYTLSPLALLFSQTNSQSSLMNLHGTFVNLLMKLKYGFVNQVTSVEEEKYF